MRTQKGFTLVELVVVVMILGILAAVAAPKLLSTSSAATENGLRQTLQVVRDAIERYAAENGGKLPGDLGTEVDFKNDMKPYLRGAFPICPVGAKDDEVDVVAVAGPLTGAAAPTKAWKYSSTDGSFICNSTELTKSGAPVGVDTL